MDPTTEYDIDNLGQKKAQEIHRDRIAQVYFGQTSDNETQRRARERIDWTLEQVVGQKIYDIGCSEGVTAIKLAQMGRDVDAIDINPEVIQYAQDLADKMASDAPGQLAFSVRDIFTVPDIQPEYDAVVMGEVLEHVFEPGNMIRRALLSLKVGGQMIITTPWGYFPAPDHHQTYYMTNFLGLIPDELACTHLSVVDGYIRFIAQKTHDPLSKDSARKPVTQPVVLDDASLLQMTETAALESQTFLRNHLDGRNALLEQARAQANLLANKLTTEANKHRATRLEAQGQKRILENEITRLKVAKQQLSLERSLLPKFISRLRKVRRTIRLEGFRPAMGIFTKAVVRRLSQSSLGKKIFRYAPLQFKKEASAFLEAKVAKLDDAMTREIAKAAQSDFVILCNSFPGEGQRYGGEFIRARLDAYLEQGLEGSVVHISNTNALSCVESYQDTPHKVFRISDAHVAALGQILAGGRAKVLVHSPPPNMQKALQKKLDHKRLFFWFHGFEVRDYRRLFFNYTTPELAAQRQKLYEISKWRIAANRITFANGDITKIFVSNFLKDIAERDNGIAVENGHVIANFINGDVFSYQEKTAEQMKRFLLIRSFDRRNYANDIAIEAIKIASQREGFDKLHFTIRGFGNEFAELTLGIEHLENVTLEEKYSTSEDMVRLHREHGVFLCPSRFDTQGVTMGEAMASGLVCITNPVTGIPEFTDDDSSILVPGDDPVAYADAIFYAAANPSEMLEKSRAGAQRVRSQCGLDQTVIREIELAQLGASKASDI